MSCWVVGSGSTAFLEASLTASDKNKAEIDDVIHKYIGEKSSMGKCSADWKKARVQIQEDPKMKAELIERLKTPA